jgi:hypothetical protein
MNYGLGRRISFHEEVEIVPIQEFSSTALVEPFEKDTCSREDEPGDPSLIKGHAIVGNVSSDFRTESFP